jgi:beta-lactamase regulating signal transducer with metallopeptidase domain
MTEFVFFASQPWTDRLAWTLLHFLWQGTLICCAFIALRALFAPALAPRARYGLACAALALMAIAPVITFVILGSAKAPTLYHFVSEPRANAVHAVEPWVRPSAFYSALLPWIVAVWFTGALAFSVRLAGGWLVASRLRFAGVVRPAPADWQHRLSALALRVGISGPVRLLVSSLAQTPMAVGHLRPVVLVPIGALAGLPADQLEALLAHELAHVFRYDYLANLLQSVVEALLFYHPAVWWISRQIHAERELCCDDIAVTITGDRVGYARALADLETFRSSHPQPALAANDGDLLARIRRLVDPPASSAARPGLGAAIAIAILVFVGVAAAAVPQPSTVRIATGRAKRAAEDFPLHGAGRILTAINIRGISEQAADELLARLPVHEGDLLAPESYDWIKSVAQPYGKRIECRVDYIGADSAILDIHPAGLAGAPVIHRR